MLVEAVLNPTATVTPPTKIVSPRRCFICCQEGPGFSRNAGLTHLNPLECHSLTQLLEFSEPTAETLLNAQVCSACHEKIEQVPRLYQQLELVSMELAETHDFLHKELMKPYSFETTTECAEFLRTRKQAQNGS